MTLYIRSIFLGRSTLKSSRSDEQLLWLKEGW